MIPRSTVARLPLYLRALEEIAADGVTTTSSGELAAIAGVGPAQLRRDLASLGSHGVRGVGYDVAHLHAQVAAVLGVTADLAVVIVGIGNLGHALANYVAGAGAGEGFRVVALLDTGAVVGTTVAGLVVEHADALEAVVEREAARIAVLATPADVAQEVCDRLVAAGVTAVLSFVPRVLQTPDGVDVRSVDLARELQILAFHEQRKARGAPTTTAPPE